MDGLDDLLNGEGDIHINWDANEIDEEFEAEYYYNTVAEEGVWTNILHPNQTLPHVDFNLPDKIMLETLKQEAKIIMARIKQKSGVCYKLFYSPIDFESSFTSI